MPFWPRVALLGQVINKHLFVITTLKDKEKEGKKLTALSTIIIFYVVGGATVDSSVRLFGGTITLDRPWAITVAFFIVLFYIWNNYRIENKDWKKKIQLEIDKNLGRDEFIVNRTQKIIGQRKKEIKERMGKKTPLEGHDIEVEKCMPSIKEGQYFFEKYENEKKKLKLNVILKNPNGRVSDTTLIDFPGTLYNIRWFVVFFKIYITKKDFVVLILPYLTLTYALTVLITDYLISKFFE